MAATIFTEVMHPFAPLIEALHNLSIDEVIIAQNQTIVVGAILGAIGVAADESSTTTANAGNTGNGTVGTVTIGSTALNGNYTILMLTAGATAEFSLTDPNGAYQGSGKVGTAFTGPVSFTITTGGTSYAVGDEITIAVLRPFDEGGEQFEAWTPTATDGSQVANAIAMYPAVTGSGQTAKIAAVRRDAAVRGADLTFDTTATAAQIALATQQLASKNIVLR